MPYLLRVIGTEKFGIISLMQAIQYFFIIFVDYGFNTTGVKEISVSRNDKCVVSFICSRILFAKLFLTLLSFGVLLLLLFLIPRFGNEWKTYLYGFSMVVGQALFPVWFFQGIEKMRYITYLNLAAKLIFIVGLFFFIREQSDYVYFVPIQAIGVIIASFIGIIIIVYRLKVHIYFPGWSSLFLQMKGSGSVFISNLSVTLYNSGNYLILSFFGDDRMLGIYSVAEKIMLLLRQILSMFSQAVFPRVCLLITQSHSQLRRFWSKVTPPFGIFVFVSCVVVSFSSETIVSLLTRESVEEIATLLSVMIWIPLIVFFNIPFFQTLTAYSLNAEVMRILILSSVFCVITSLFLTSHFFVLGATISLLLTEFLVTFSLLLTLESRKSISIL